MKNGSLGLYITALFEDHQINNPPLLEDITTFYSNKYYHTSNKLKWNPNLTQNTCYLAVVYIIAYIIMQLHIIHQRPRIMIVYHMISEVIQNNLICIIRFHGIDIPILFQ